ATGIGVTSESGATLSWWDEASPSSCSRCSRHPCFRSGRSWRRSTRRTTTDTRSCFGISSWPGCRSSPPPSPSTQRGRAPDLCRFARFNSWDVVTRPHLVLSVIRQEIDSPLHDPKLVVALLVLTASLLVGYLVLYAFAALRLEPAELTPSTSTTRG